MLEILEALRNSKKINPEVWHARNYIHPGYQWNIKTIIPSKKIIDLSAKFITDLWDKIEKNHPGVIQITDFAYDWDGQIIKNWRTIWLNKHIDIICNYSSVTYEIISYDEGLKKSAIEYKQYINSNFDPGQYSILLLQYNDILDALLLHTSDDIAKQNRKKWNIIS